MSWHTSFAPVTNCYSTWILKQLTQAHKSTFAIRIRRKEGGISFRQRSATSHNPERTSGTTSSLRLRFAVPAWASQLSISAARRLGIILTLATAAVRGTDSPHSTNSCESIPAYRRQSCASLSNCAVLNSVQHTRQLATFVP